MNTEQTAEAGTELLQSIFKEFFEVAPELIDVSWWQYEVKDKEGTYFETSCLQFHIRKEYFESRLEDGQIMLKLDKDLGPDHPNYWSVLNSHDLLDLKKGTDFYNRMDALDKHVIKGKADILKKLFGVGVQVVFSAGQFTITPLE